MRRAWRLELRLDVRVLSSCVCESGPPPRRGRPTGSAGAADLLNIGGLTTRAPEPRIPTSSRWSGFPRPSFLVAVHGGAIEPLDSSRPVRAEVLLPACLVYRGVVK